MKSVRNSLVRLIQNIGRVVDHVARNPLFINAFVKSEDGLVVPWNWGDDINYHFIKLISHRNISIYFDDPLAMFLNRRNYLCIGSTLNYLTTPQTVVWGAGVIDPNLELRSEPENVLAVRGPLTREYLLNQGLSCPEVYGDPALLIPYFYRPQLGQAKTSRKIGLLPHYKDQNSKSLNEIKRAKPDLIEIDIASYGKWTDLIDEIASCDAIYSSSLHGLVVAEAFGVPNRWIELSDKVEGRGFKFRDFFASIQKKNMSPMKIKKADDLNEDCDFDDWKSGKIDLQKLLNSCPFEIREPLRYEHPLVIR